MKLLTTLALSLLLALSITGCSAPPLVRGQADRINLGDSDATVAAKFGKSIPDMSHRFTASSRNYRADHYRLQTGTTQSGTVVCTPTCIYVPITVPVFTPFAVVYSDPDFRVIAFGTIEELSKSPDDTISGLMPDLKTSYQKALQDKKGAK